MESMEVVLASRSVRAGERRVTRSPRCSLCGSRCDPEGARWCTPNGGRYRTNHYRRYIAPNPGRVLQLTGAIGAQPVTPSEVL